MIVATKDVTVAFPAGYALPPTALLLLNVSSDCDCDRDVGSVNSVAFEE